MSTKYYDLIHNRDLYSPEFIDSFGVTAKHWYNEDDRSRELSLRHDMCCVLLCNTEPLGIPGYVDYCYLMKKRSIAAGHEKGTPAKRPRIETDEAGPSQDSYSSDSDEEENRQGHFRCELIEDMPNAPEIQAALAKEFGCKIPDKTWDIADRDLKKFIEVKVTRDIEGSIKRYKVYKMDIPGNCALVLVNPVNGKVVYEDHPGGLRGEQKVTQFILKRHHIVADMGLVESDVQEVKDLEEFIFCDDVFSTMVDVWLTDINNFMSLGPYRHEPTTQIPANRTDA